MTMLSRTSRMLEQKLSDYRWEVLPHVPCSVDMSQPDLNIPEVNTTLRERRFSTLEDLSTEGPELFDSK